MSRAPCLRISNATLFFVTIPFPGAALAQEQRPSRTGPAVQVEDPRARPADAQAADPDAPPRMVARPDRPRPGLRPRTYGSNRFPPRRYPGFFDLRPQFYPYGYGYRFGVPAFDAFEIQLEHAYQVGVEEGRRAEQAETRLDNLLVTYEYAMETGRRAFAEGRYGFAARHFLLAASLDQSDVIARLSAGQAHIALEEYTAAAGLLRRAFELQPKLVYLPLDVRGPYERIADFETHMENLRQAARVHPDEPDVWFVYGYYAYYSYSMAEAAGAFEKAAKLRPDDRLAAQLQTLARLGARDEPPPE